MRGGDVNKTHCQGHRQTSAGSVINPSTHMYVAWRGKNNTPPDVLSLGLRANVEDNCPSDLSGLCPSLTWARAITGVVLSVALADWFPWPQTRPSLLAVSTRAGGKGLSVMDGRWRSKGRTINGGTHTAEDLNSH